MALVGAAEAGAGARRGDRATARGRARPSVGRQIADKSGQVWRSAPAMRLRGLLCAGVGLAALVAFGTYHATDPSLNVATGEAARNWVGYPGAVVADACVQSLGVSAWAAALVVVLLGFKRAATRDPHSNRSLLRLRAAIGVVGFMLSAAALAAFTPPHGWPLARGLGGFWGERLLSAVAALLARVHAPEPRYIGAAVFGLLSLIALGWSWGVGRKGLVRAGSLAAAGGGAAGRLLRSAPRVGGSLEADEAEAYAPEPFDPDALPSAIRRRKTRAPAPMPEQDEAAAPVDPASDEPADDIVRVGEAASAPRPAPSSSAPSASAPSASAPSASALAAPAPAPKVAIGVTPPKAKAPDPDAFEPANVAVQEGDFQLPTLDMLAKPKPRSADFDENVLQANARLLEEVLSEFGVKGKIDQIRPGPVVTMYELVPAPGVKSSRVIALSDDIARSMSARSCRVSVVPGRNAIGIEMPNANRETVYFRDLLASAEYDKPGVNLPMALGETIGGETYIADLSKMPHLLIAGTTGSGKSVGVNAMILSILFKLSPEQCRFIMIDPKMLELSVYDGIPHLLAPVVTDPKKAIVALKWTVREMENRYRRMSKIGVRNIAGFNERAHEALSKGEHFERTVQTGFDEGGRPVYETEQITPEPMPFLVVVIDEVADLMMVAGKDIEGAVQRLAQMARAAGIHLIMATQRPSVDVITGTIKANFPTRISFQVTSKIDARTILGEQGAEQLLGMGDMLYMAGGGRIQRLHGPFVSDEEVDKVARFLRDQGLPQYIEEVTAAPDEDGEGEGGGSGDGEGSPGDLYDQAVAVVTRDRKASTSYVQRRLQIGYNRAASLIERMEKEGVVGAANHAGKRDVLAPPPPPL